MAQVSCDGATVPAHRIVLAARCEPLHAMLAGGMREDGAATVQLSLSEPVIRALLQFLYVCVGVPRTCAVRVRGGNGCP